MNSHFRLVGAVLAVAVVAVGCGSTTEPTSDPADATICRHLQDVAIEITQEWIDAAESHGVTVEEWEASPDSPFGEDGDVGLFERREEFVERWDGYDCAGEAFDVVRWRYDELVYTERIGEYLVEQFRNYG